MLRWVLNRKQRKTARSIAREAWMNSGRDIDKAKALARAEAKQTYGSLLTAIVVIGAVLEICYTLFKFWRDAKVLTPSIHPQENEPI